MAVIRLKDIVEMDAATLKVRLIELSNELNSERGIVASGGRATNPGRIKELRKTIARIFTIARNRKIDLQKAEAKVAEKKTEEKKTGVKAGGEDKKSEAKASEEEKKSESKASVILEKESNASVVQEKVPKASVVQEKKSEPVVASEEKVAKGISEIGDIQ